ncbi:hypothetical protein CBS147332_8393 [Penicillium roqueforti]|nr:hypothetical protein CBS147332_8393 [Penicillium roqueforti]KAI3100065.1 hypothetical protein CBS147331_8436 [Penicillium roqueforti]
MSQIDPPNFKNQTIHKREDGYWIEKFYYHKDDKAPGLIVSGLGGKVEYLENPLRAKDSSSDDNQTWVRVPTQEEESGSSREVQSDDYEYSDTSKEPKSRREYSSWLTISQGWKSYLIQDLNTPVPTASMDMTGDGFNDVIVGFNYGATMIDSDPNGGDIFWLENPGANPKDPSAKWEKHFIGRWPTVHRLATGYFTQRTFPEIIAAPVVHGPHDKKTPVPLICFQKPDNRHVKEVTEWRKDIVDDGHFRVVHEIYKKSLDGPNGLDSLLVASMDGVSRLYYEKGHWKREHIANGELPTRGKRENSFFPAAGDLWGAGTADAGKLGSNPFAYVAVNEPFHGPYVSLYTRNERGQPGNPWKRHILDVYGTPTQKKCWGDGPIHNIVCADIDGDGDEEFLVSMFGPVDRDSDGNTPNVDVFGPSPNKGIWCYKVIDLEKGIVAKWHIAQGSSARCTVGDFSAKGRADLASLSYHVDRYYREKHPVVTLHRNQHDSYDAGPQITGSYWGGDGMVYVPRPTDPDLEGKSPLKMDLVEVANYLISVEVYSPKQEVAVRETDGIKVLFGSMKGKNEKETVRRPLGGDKFPAKESLKPKSGEGFIAHERNGAILLRLKELKEPCRWRHASNVPVVTRFDLTKQGIKFPKLQFIKVNDLWWGGKYDENFFNMSGFHFRLQDNMQGLCHMQFWIAGANVEAKYHDHNDDSFKELHTCLSQGTPGDGKKHPLGGMSEPCNAVTEENPQSSKTQTHPSPLAKVKHCGLKPLEEHGRMWHADATGRAVYRTNDTVSYPPHQWAAGCGGPDKCVDVWMALEFDGWLDFNL